MYKQKFDKFITTFTNHNNSLPSEKVSNEKLIIFFAFTMKIVVVPTKESEQMTEI